MIVTNQTSSDIYFGPLHLGAGIGTQLTIDDTSATSLYLTNDSVADAVNNAYNSNKITVSGQAQPFPRPTGTPSLLHGTGSPEGLVYAPQGSIYMRRDGVQTNGGVIYVKTSGITFNTQWLDIATAAGTAATLPTGTINLYAAASAPTGWLLCNGAAVSRTTYSVLFGVISTIYGSGDGSTTFNVPDFIGRVPVGLSSSGPTLINALGNNDGVLTNSRNIDHRHTYTMGNQGGTVTAGGYMTNNATYYTGGDSNNLNHPAFLVINYIIKT